ncbi:MAG: hypothetical protein ACK4GM_06185 [Tabrizicola sp.]
MADPAGSLATSSAARARSAPLYSTTGGQMFVTGGSEPPVAQAVSKLVAITRTTSRRFQHPALDVIGLLRYFKSFGEASRSLAGSPKRKQEQKHGEDDGAEAERRPHPWAAGDPGEERSNHRRPRFQSSSRA